MATMRPNAADTISTPVAVNQLFDRYFEQFEQTQTALAQPLSGIVPAGRPQDDVDTDDYYEDFAPPVDGVRTGSVES